jgi:hypothetical protein
MKKNEAAVPQSGTIPQSASLTAPFTKGSQGEETSASGSQKKGDGILVYCGPSVRYVARQYTVFAGEIPAALAEFIRKHPAAGALLVPVEKFAETRRKLETKGTAEAVLYNKVKSEL